jgi:hypothetical protein
MAEQYLDGVTGTVAVSLFHFYDSLTYLRVLVDASEEEKEAWLNRVDSNQEKMQKWAHHVPMNHLHKFYLVEAERHRVQGSYIEAMEYYDRAIALAKENEYLNSDLAPISINP